MKIFGYLETCIISAGQILGYSTSEQELGGIKYGQGETVDIVLRQGKFIGFSALIFIVYLLGQLTQTTCLW